MQLHLVKVTIDAGLLVYRELDNAFGLTDTVAFQLKDNRTEKCLHSVEGQNII